MNKKLIAAVLTALMLLALSGCGCQNSAYEETEPETTAGETEPPAIESLPGVVYNPEGGAEDLDEVEATENTKESENASTGKDKTDETTAPTTGKENNKPEETTAPTTGKENNKPVETTAPTTGGDSDKDSEETTAPTAGASTVTAYESYHAMSGAAQKEFIDSFDSIEAFFEWYNAAKAEYEALHPDIDVGDGNVDLGDLNG